MSNWRPNCPPEVAAQRARMLARVRNYFARQDVLPVTTPMLATSTASDPRIESLQTTGGQYLQTSPESHMKRLLADGYPDIYSIGRVFRAGESGKRHLPEFTMIEWYRLGMDLDEIIADTTALVVAALDRPELLDTATRMNYAQALNDFAGIEPSSASIDELAVAARADTRLRDALGDDRDAWLDLLLATLVASRFADNGLTIVQHFPASQAALARCCPADKRVADRFEVFFGDLELANGFVELTDASEQATRFEDDLHARRANKSPHVPTDVQLLAALEAGLPDCAGVAVGFERLHMIAAAASDIRDVVTFSA